MKSSLTLKHILFVQFIVTLACSHFAFSDRGGADLNYAMMRQEERTAPIEVQGLLEGSASCGEAKRPADEDGAPACQLKIHDAKTGRDYRVTGNNRITEDAQTLYQTGIRNVSVEGKMDGSDTIAVQKIEKL